MRADDKAGWARVVSVGRNAAWIVFDDELTARPAAIPKRRQRLSLVTGDRIFARRLEDGRAIVDRREARNFSLTRRTAGGRQKTMAANVDNLAVVTSFDRPPLNLAMVDEILAFGQLHDVPATIILTKPDLVDAERCGAIVQLYATIGYEVLAVNPKAGQGMDRVATALAMRHSLLIGQSGVGKSSLFRALGGQSIVGEVSAVGRGRQTTTSARLHRFGDGFLIDSPGVGEFALHRPTRSPDDEWFAELTYAFREFRPLAFQCRFTDCTHRVEPECAVRAAVDAGTIARSRYESFLFIAAREEAAERNR